MNTTLAQAARRLIDHCTANDWRGEETTKHIAVLHEALLKAETTKAEAKPLTDEQIAEAVFHLYPGPTGEDVAEMCFDHDRDVARAVERACAEAWGVKLAGIGASAVEAKP